LPISSDRFSGKSDPVARHFGEDFQYLLRRETGKLQKNVRAEDGGQYRFVHKDAAPAVGHNNAEIGEPPRGPH
jgi:hypothetical protein